MLVENEKQSMEEQLGILKSIWSKDASGRWIVQGLKGIDLNPREGFEKDYFKIENDINTLTPSPGQLFGLDLFSSFGETDFLLKQSIVPIVAYNAGDREIRCIGTGFFISASGYLMTAAHVLRDPVDEKYTDIKQVGDNTFRLGDGLRLGALIPPNPAMRNAPFGNIHPAVRAAKFFLHTVEWAFHWGRDVPSPLLHEDPKFKYDVDVAILKIKENQMGGAFQPLNIGAHKLNIGDRAVAVGYAEMKNIPINSSGGVDDFEQDLFVSVGKVKNIYLNNHTENQTTTPGPCFDFDARIPGKMSGAPILVGSGIMTKGIVSRSWQDENHASGCLVAPVMSLKLQDNKSLFELMKSGNEGIAQIYGADL